MHRGLCFYIFLWTKYISKEFFRYLRKWRNLTKGWLTRDQISLSSKAERGLNLKLSPTSLFSVFECTCTEEVHLWTCFHSVWFLLLFDRRKCQIMKDLSVEYPLFQETGKILRGTENIQNIPSLVNLMRNPNPITSKVCLCALEGSEVSYLWRSFSPATEYLFTPCRNQSVKPSVSVRDFLLCPHTSVSVAQHWISSAVPTIY